MNTLKTLVLLALCAFTLLIGLVVIPAQAAPAFTPTLHKERVTVTTSGATGSATGSNTTSAVIAGQIMRIDVDYGSLTTTTDITITQTNERVSNPVVVKADSATDATYYPVITGTNNGGTAMTYDGTHGALFPYPAADQLTVNLAETTAATPAVTVDIYWKE